MKKEYIRLEKLVLGGDFGKRRLKHEIYALSPTERIVFLAMPGVDLTENAHLGFYRFYIRVGSMLGKKIMRCSMKLLGVDVFGFFIDYVCFLS